MEHALAGTPDRWIDGSGGTRKSAEASTTTATDTSAPASTDTPAETAPTTPNIPDDIF